MRALNSVIYFFLPDVFKILILRIRTNCLAIEEYQRYNNFNNNI